MYPFFRVAWTLQSARRRPRVPLYDTCSLDMSVWITDLDIYGELNNARYLTLMEIARWDMAVRTGLLEVTRRHRWGFVVAGCSIRYRKRLTLGQRFEMRTRLAGTDERWFYMEQSVFRHGIQHTGALFRTALTAKDGIVPPERVLREMGEDRMVPVPDWVRIWDQSDRERPWHDQASRVE
jgi:YbgC/YbaW family acyl-CoA thioester hydrolase